MAGNANQEILLGDGDLPYPYRIGNLYSAQTINSGTGTGSLLLVTGNPGYYLTELGYHADLTCTLAAGGMINITFADSSFGTIANFRLFVPASVTLPLFATTIRQVNQGPFIWSNKVANSTLSVSINTALTAGTIRCFARYGTTSYLG